ncbi:MAG TPA: CGNR zinc finger domain-containing protein [Thermoanaerobaculia bacterium]|nr:CGNR zinc finger domain-containing protein [Thermoanaerobaculia bacterium]
MVTALEFINTVGGRTHSTPTRYVVDRERLHSLDDFFEWAGAVKRSRLSFERVLRFREALYRIFKAMIDARKPDAADLEILNRELAEARAHERLALRDGRIVVTFDDSNLLHVIARDAASLLTSEQLSRVRQCGGESCGWLFLDTSRNRSRQWCDMRDCGNLAKVRRFRERQRKG